MQQLTRLPDFHMFKAEFFQYIKVDLNLTWNSPTESTVKFPADGIKRVTHSSEPCNAHITPTMHSFYNLWQEANDFPHKKIPNEMRIFFFDWELHIAMNARTIINCINHPEKLHRKAAIHGGCTPHPPTSTRGFQRKDWDRRFLIFLFSQNGKRSIYYTAHMQLITEIHFQLLNNGVEWTWSYDYISLSSVWPYHISIHTHCT